MEPELKNNPNPLKMESPTDYIELSEIQERFDICYQVALAWAKSMYFPSFKLGKQKILIPRAAFEKFVSDPDNIVAYHLKTYPDRKGQPQSN